MIATFRHLLWIVAVLGGLAIPCSAQNNNPDEEAKRLAATSPFAKREGDLSHIVAHIVRTVLPDRPREPRP